MTASLVYGIRSDVLRDSSKYNDIVEDYGFEIKNDVLFHYGSKISVSDTKCSVKLGEGLGLPYGITNTLACLLADMGLSSIDHHSTNWFLILED